MANRRRSTTTYSTYGSVAYAPAYDGSAVRVPRREEEIRYAPRPKTRKRPEERALTRARVQVREAGAVSPFSVIGFLAVGIFASLLLFSYSQFATVNDQVISTRGNLNTLQTEYTTLSAQYERVFDIERIQQAVGNTMVRPTEDQVEYLDLSAPDTVTLYGQEKVSGVAGALAGLKDIVSEVIEYFR